MQTSVVAYLVKLTRRDARATDGVGCVFDQGLGQLGHVGEVAAAHNVQVVVVGRVLLALGRRLDAALGHHGVGVAVAQLGGEDHLRALLLGQQRGRRSGTAAADDQHVGLVGRRRQIDLVRRHAAARFDQVGEFVGDLVTLARTHRHRATAFFLEVGVEFQPLLALVEVQEGNLFAAFLALDPLGARLLDDLDPLFEFRGVRHGSSSWRG